MRRKVKQRTADTVQTLWQNKRSIVHVVFTRFMQQQGTLLQLGSARLKLFETLCLPTLAQQINQQFLWIIRTDLELHSTLKEGLIEALDGLPNVLVVASNVGVDGYHDGSFRKNQAMEEFTTHSEWHGDLDLVRSYHKASKQHTLLEMNLDKSVQAMTAATFQNDRSGIGWVQLCLGRHLEWHF
jgi:hypothetical protein